MAKEIYDAEINSTDIGTNWTSYLPAVLATVGACLMLLLKLQFGERFMSDGALMMVALAFYVLAALFQLTNLYAYSEMSRKIALWGATIGVFFNLSAWLVRWVAAYEHEIAILRAGGSDETPWIWRYVPLANLYDFSLLFAFGAGIATLLLARKKSFQILGAFSLPLAALILTLARFIGSEFIDLPPVLDSYWRPIHVGVAALSYGVAMVCFAIAVLFLLKNRSKVEAMAIWSCLFGFSVIVFISKFSVFTEFTYRAGLMLTNPTGGKPISTPFRLDLPFVGEALAITGLLLLGVMIAFGIYLYNQNETAKKVGHGLIKIAFLAQIISIVMLVGAVRSIDDPVQMLQQQLNAHPNQYITAGLAIAEGQNLSAAEYSALTPIQLEQMSRTYLQANSKNIYSSLNANPVELSGLITAIAGTFFILIFAFRTETVIRRLPSLEVLDNLMYKTACLAFAGLAMLLITGAIWANESWGRPWAFDSKETGALIAWLTYAGFLHTRISRGWKGKSSAYFAIVGFLLVVFTYLGVSYLLPGLHSYA